MSSDVIASDLLAAWYHAFTSLTDDEVAGVTLKNDSAMALNTFALRVVRDNQATYDATRARIGVNVSGRVGEISTLSSPLSLGVFVIAADGESVTYSTVGSDDTFDTVFDKSATDESIMNTCVKAYLMRWRLATKRFLSTLSLFSGPEIANGLYCWFNQPGLPWLLDDSTDLLNSLCDREWTRIWDINVPTSIAHHFTEVFRCRVYRAADAAMTAACAISGYRERDGAVVGEWCVRQRDFSTVASRAIFHVAKKHLNNASRVPLYTRNMPYLTSLVAPRKLVNEALKIVRKAVAACATEKGVVVFQRSQFDPRDECNEASWTYFASKVYEKLTPLQIITALVRPEASCWRFVSRVGSGVEGYEFTLSEVLLKFNAVFGKRGLSHFETDVKFMLLHVPSLAAKHRELLLDGITYLLRAGERYTRFLYGGGEFEARFGPPSSFGGDGVGVTFDETAGRFVGTDGMQLSNAELAEMGLIASRDL